MEWIKLSSEDQLGDLVEASHSKPLVIYKHSTRCSISALTFDRLNRGLGHNNVGNTNTCFLDIIKHRELSNKIANDFNVRHQSPQILLIKSQNCTYHDSHFGISGDELKRQINKVMELS